MILDKEYPATHSMSTAWYIVDEDGNVGIMDFDDNGPVPWMAQEDTCTEDLLCGHLLYRNDGVPFNLTESQINEMVGEPLKTIDDVFNAFDLLVKIDVDELDKFRNYCKSNGLSLGDAFVERMGIYSITPNKEKFLERLFDCKMVKAIYNNPDCWIDDEYDENTDQVVHSLEMKELSLPYYVYSQPYWTTRFLPKKVNTPKTPVKIDQIPESFRERIIKVPLKFSETNEFQIAEYCPCRTMGVNDSIVVDGCLYEKLPQTNNSDAFFLTNLLEDHPVTYCARHKDGKCRGLSCHIVFPNCFTTEPTVFRVFSPTAEIDYYEKAKADSVMLRSLCMSYVPCLPIGYNEWEDIKDGRNGHGTKKIVDFFMTVHPYFESKVKKFNPYVIISDKESAEVLKLKYEIGDHSIVINEQTYAFYLTDEMKERNEEILHLALMPYRGEKIPYKLSVEEVERLRKEEK